MWDVEDAVPYEICHCEERSDAAIRSPQSKETDSHASDTVTGVGMTGVGCGRRDTRVPPYRVRRFYGADRVVRPYKRLSEISVWDVGDAVPYGRGAAAIHMYTEKELPEGSSFDLVISGVRLRSSPAPS